MVWPRRGGSPLLLEAVRRVWGGWTSPEMKQQGPDSNSCKNVARKKKRGGRKEEEEEEEEEEREERKRERGSLMKMVVLVWHEEDKVQG